MTPFEEIINDPVVQLLILVVIAVGVFDAMKLALSWIWKLLGGKQDE